MPGIVCHAVSPTQRTALLAIGSDARQRNGSTGSLVFVSSPFFPSKLAKGYDNSETRVVKTVNGIAIRNLAHLVEILRDCSDEFITLEFEIRGAETLVFRHAEMLAATDEILTDNGVRTQGSPDMLAIWNAKPRAVASK